MIHVAFALNTDGSDSLAGITVSLFTWSKTHHCELVFNDGMSLSAGPEGITLSKRDFDHYKWSMVPVPWIDYPTELKIREWAESIVAKKPKYDWVGAILGRLHSDVENEDRWFCSELVMAALYPYCKGFDPEKWYSPKTVWKILNAELLEYNPELAALYRYRFRKK